ncbi:MAG: Sapep family Mn(2+)-dependent dipeptidase [Clostridia bacterium]|nr:Sapep family Mn(2+)-dependent dipeptidase [Clostridia bacterium]
MLDPKVAALIDSYAAEYAAMLTRWVQVPSVKGEPEDGAPFGAQVRRMLDMAMVDCETMGFLTHVYDGYACDATLGDEDWEMLAVLAHLDVVPAGDGWRVPPFSATREGDKILGRGTSDDKGPALAAMFAMKAIKEAGIPLRRSIRLILGCDEESGWEDMDWYCEHAKMPAMGFSPDASFPLINTEKGMIHALARAEVSREGLQVKYLHTGERLNVIPGESVAVLEGSAALAERVKAYAEKSGLPYTAELTAEGVRVTAHGIPGHSAYPEGCRNANGMMLLLLKALGVQGALATLADAYPMEYDGKALGIACADDVSGPLTCNMGILHLDDGVITASLDCRCPVNADLDALVASIRQHLPGFRLENLSTTQPHHVPADSELVTALLAAYHDQTGLPAVAESTGGGTYAKVLAQGVAFGAAFPGDEDLAHQANEYVEIPKMMLAAKIYADALIRLCGAQA